MDIQNISQLVDKLNSDIPKEGAVVKFKQGYDDNEAEIVGTKNGLLRLGVEFLRAGMTTGPFMANTELKYLLHKDSTFEPWIINIVDEILPEPVKSLKQRLKDAFLAAIGLILLGCAIGAIIALMKYVFRLVF